LQGVAGNHERRPDSCVNWVSSRGTLGTWKAKSYPALVPGQEKDENKNKHNMVSGWDIKEMMSSAACPPGQCLQFGAVGRAIRAVSLHEDWAARQIGAGAMRYFVISAGLPERARAA